MQSLLSFDKRPNEVLAVHAQLLRYFGRPESDYRLAPLDQFVLSYISSQTRDEVSAVVFENLLKSYASWDALLEAEVSEIRNILSDVTYSENKAPNLRQALLEISLHNGTLHLDNLHHMSVSHAMTWLERLAGVGPKIAASVLNKSNLRRPVLVIDTHHLRVLKRLGFLGRKANFERAYDVIMPILPKDWNADDMSEHHHLMKLLGQGFCRPTHPRCRPCPLVACCRTYQNRI